MLIPKDKRVQSYELTFLVSAALTGEETVAIDAAVEKLVSKHKGTVKNREDWGKRPLAYTIKHSGKRHVEGAYKHWVIEFETSQAFSFEKDLYLNQEILRHLFVIAEAVPVSSEEKATPKAA